MRYGLFKSENFLNFISFGRITHLNSLNFVIVILLILNSFCIQVVDAQWSNNTENYFGNEPLALRITSVADWNNSMEIGFFGTEGENRKKLLWYCRAVTGSTLYTKCWESLDFSSAIVSTIVADLNRDGHLDILVQCENATIYFVDGYQRDAPPIQLRGWPSFNGNLPLVSLASVFANCGLPDIALVDIHGSLIIMRGTTITVDSICSGSGVPTYESSVLVHGEKQVREVVPLSLSSDDINGDCAVDFLYMVHDIKSNSLEIYSFFTLGSRHELLLNLKPAGLYGIPTFSDVNGDGAPDIVIPTCANTTSFGECTLFDGITVFFNVMRGTGPCSKQGCCEGHQYGFSEQKSKKFSLTPLDSCGILRAEDDRPLGMPHSVVSPMILRFGDYNRDGYPDIVVPSTYGPLLLVGQSPDSTSEDPPFVCTPLIADAASAPADTVPEYTSAVPFFAAVSGRMRYDVVLTSHDTNALPVSVYLNYASLDQDYFLASSALNGASRLDAWGVYQPSAVHRFAWNDMSMRQRLAYGVQMSKSQGHSLQSSVLLLGLGRTFSYVQDYAVGIIAGGVLMRRRWSVYLVPSSKVFIWLHSPYSPYEWRLQLYIAFVTYTKHFSIALGIALTLIGIPIVILKFREVQQDRREWKLR